MTVQLILAVLLLVAAASPSLAGDAAGSRGADGEPLRQDAVAAVARKADGDSLLFSSEALALIEHARRGEPGPRAPVAALSVTRARPVDRPAVIHLSAIVYRAPDDWRVWLNGRSFTPRTPAPGPIEILEVTPDGVVLAWRGDPAERPARVALQPNQSYLVASGQIVEGKPAAAARRARR